MVFKGSIVCLIGAALLYAGFYSASYNMKLMSEGKLTYGQVTSYDVWHASDEKRYSAIAKFEVAGQQYSTTPENHYLYRPYNIRDIVEVVYLPDDPTQSKLNDDVYFGTSTFLPAGIGILAMLFGFGMITGRVQRMDDVEGS